MAIFWKEIKCDDYSFKYLTTPFAKPGSLLWEKSFIHKPLTLDSLERSEAAVIIRDGTCKPSNALHVSGHDSFDFGKGCLVRLKLKALRSGVWFRTLKRIDRVLIDVTLQVASRIRSPILLKTPLPVVTQSKNSLARALFDGNASKNSYILSEEMFLGWGYQSTHGAQAKMSLLFLTPQIRLQIEL